LTPIKASPSTISPTAAVNRPFTAVRPNFQSACRTMAMMTGFTPVEQPADLRQRAEPDVGDRNCQHNHHGWEDEARAAEDQPWPSRSDKSEINGQFRRAGPRIQIGRSEQIQKLLPSHAAPLLDHLRIHHGDGSGWAAERVEPQIEEKCGDFPQPRSRRGACGGLGHLRPPTIEFLRRKYLPKKRAASPLGPAAPMIPGCADDATSSRPASRSTRSPARPIWRTWASRSRGPSPPSGGTGERPVRTSLDRPAHPSTGRW